MAGTAILPRDSLACVEKFICGSIFLFHSMHSWLSVNKLLCQLSVATWDFFDVMLSQIRIMNGQKQKEVMAENEVMRIQPFAITKKELLQYWFELRISDTHRKEKDQKVIMIIFQIGSIIMYVPKPYSVFVQIYFFGYICTKSKLVCIYLFFCFSFSPQLVCATD